MIEVVKDLGLIPDFNNKLTVQLIENGRVIQEEKTHNFVSKQAKLNAEYFYKCHLIKGNGLSTSMYPANIGLQYSQMNLWDNTTNFEDQLYMLNNNGTLNITGYCTNWSTDISGDAKKGAYLASAGSNSGSSTTYCWEWATSQGNGIIKSLGFTAASGNNLAEAGHNLVYSNIPALANLINPMYIGWRTAGSDQVLYFRGFGTYTNNIIGIKASDFSLVETLSLNIAGGILNNVYNARCENSWGSQSCNDTVLCNGYFYTVNSCGSGSINVKKASTETLTYGTAFNISFALPNDFSMPCANTFTAITSDGIRYIYLTVTGNKSGIAYPSILLKLDTQTDTITAIDFGSLLNYSSGYGTQAITIDPSDLNMIYFSNNSPYNWASTVARYNLTTQQCIAISLPFGLPSLVIQNSNLLAKYLIIPTSSNLLYAPYSRNPSCITYAELPNPITKTSSQSLRVQYTVQLF